MQKKIQFDTLTRTECTQCGSDLIRQKGSSSHKPPLHIVKIHHLRLPTVDAGPTYITEQKQRIHCNSLLFCCLDSKQRMNY